jgi:hypothetical protein
MNFGQMTLGWLQGSSFAARLLAMPTLWTLPGVGAAPTEWTKS